MDENTGMKSVSDGLDLSVTRNSESDSSCRPCEIAALSTEVFVMNEILSPKRTLYCFF